MLNLHLKMNTKQPIDCIRNGMILLKHDHISWMYVGHVIRNKDKSNNSNHAKFTQTANLGMLQLNGQEDST